MNVNEKRLQCLTGTIKALEKFGLTNTIEYQQMINKREVLLDELSTKW